MAFRRLFESERVALVPQTPADRELFARWSYDSDYLRNLDDDPIRPVNADFFESWVGRPAQQHTDFHAFMIATRPAGERIGFISLFDLHYPNASPTLALGIGEASYRGKGYGSEAIGLLLDFAFDELGVYRVSLRVMAYNTPAIRTYEKLGFVREGTQRGVVYREGARHDLHLYGILRDEWRKP
jgi:RimJ/RimL family protein N-acetyltransferase